DARIPNKKAWEVLLEDWGVVVNSGKTMGETDEFIRMNLSGYSYHLVDFLNRLAGENKYKIKDVLLTSSTCPQSVVAAKDGYNTIYFVKPGDCVILADALKGPIEIQFSPFIGYDSAEIEIKKTDTSNNPIVIRNEKTSLSLNKI